MKVSVCLLLFAALNLTCLFAQKVVSPSGGTTTAPAGGTSPTGTTGTPIGQPTKIPAQTTTTQPAASNPRPIFISGNVAMDDGSPVPGGVNIQSVCASRQRTVAHAGPTGDFSFQWNDTTAVFQDAEDGGSFSGGSSGGLLGGGVFGGDSGGASAGLARVTDSMDNCDLRATSSGYSSSQVSLSDHFMSENFDVGTIVLHRLTGDEGRSVSILALRAPKAAVKSFEKGTEQVKAKKLPDAAASFQKAVASYPEYADAWFSLGRVESQIGATELARADFKKAMDLDAKMVGPWQQLGYMASDESKWEEAARYLDQAVRLDPTDSPMAWYFSAMANYNLGRFDLAERSLRAEIKLDHDRNARAEYLLAQVLIARKDMTGGADVLRKYIRTWPQSDNVEAAKKQLTRIDGQVSRSAQQ